MNLVNNIELTPDLIERINDLVGVDRCLLSNKEKCTETILKLKNKINTLKDSITVNLPYKFNTNDEAEFLEFCSKIENLKLKLENIKVNQTNIQQSIKNFSSQSQLEEHKIYEQELKPLVLKSISVNRQFSYFKTLIKLENYKTILESLLEQYNNLKQNQNKLENTKKSSSNNIDLEIKSCLNDQSSLLKSLIENYLEFFDYSKTLFNTRCSNFKNYLSDLVYYLRYRLSDILTLEFDNALRNLGYPQNTSYVSPTEANDNKEKLETHLKTIANYLLAIDECIDQTYKNNTVIDLLIKPLSKRFKFHFFTNKKTNDLSKPEWYLSQIIQWVKEQHEFILRVIQSVFSKVEYWKNQSATILFANKLVELIGEKLNYDLVSLIKNAKNFLHTIDELLVFNNQLSSYLQTTEQLYILSNQQSIYQSLHIICENSEFFSHWLSLEKQVWQKYLDIMFSNLPGRSVNSSSETESLLFNMPLLNDDGSLNDLWSSSSTYSNIDTMKPPKCAEWFILMIKSITDRYSSLPYASKRLRFVNLQLDLLNDFHLRLCQIIRDEANSPFSKTYLGVLNTVNYIIYILDEWKNSTFFIEMQFYKLKYQQFTKKMSIEDDHNRTHSDLNEHMCQLFDKTIMTNTNSLLEIEGTLFDEILPSYEKVKDDMLNRITQNCKWELTSRASGYRREKWMSMPLASEYYKPTLTQTASDMLISLRNMLHLLKDSLAQTLFDSIVKKLTTELDKFYYEELIMQTQFNDGGVYQLDYDINKYLMPILNEFSTNVKIENYFRTTRESISLLKLKQGSAILLKDVLNKALEIDFTESIQQQHQHQDENRKLKVYNAKNALKEFGVVQLTCEQARDVLCIRSDFVDIK